MPSSAQDRFTNAHEPVFMLVKNKKYWFDLDAVRQPYTKPLNRWGGNKIKIPRKTKWKPDDEKTKWSMSVRERKSRPNPLGKNPGDVWLINTTAYSGAHFAVFPEKLIKPMIKSTCPERICRKCGKARIRITKHDKTISEEVSNNKISSDLEYDGIATFRVQNCSKGTRDRPTGESISINWTDCGCNAGWRSGVILDPFAGSGTSILVGRRLGRNAIGIDINEKYKELAISRMKTFESEINSNLLSENQTL